MAIGGEEVPCPGDHHCLNTEKTGQSIRVGGRHQSIVVGADHDNPVNVLAQPGHIATGTDEAVQLRQHRQRIEESRYQDKAPYPPRAGEGC